MTYRCDALTLCVINAGSAHARNNGSRVLGSSKRSFHGLRGVCRPVASTIHLSQLVSTLGLTHADCLKSALSSLRREKYQLGR
jgi:hypothetical protein